MNSDFVVLDALEVSSSLTELSKVESLIDRISASSGVNDEAYGNVLIAVTEAFNNAVIHGNGNNVDLNVMIEVMETDDRLCFSLKDSGEGFDFDNIDDPTAPENIEKENGRGIYLMRHLADEVEYSEGGTRVSIVFNK